MNRPGDIAARAASVPGIAGQLALVFILSCLARIVLGMAVPAPAIFDDEWSHWEIARSFARGGGMTWSGRPINFPCWAYPLLLSIPARISDGLRAYQGAQFLNALVVSLTPLFAYGLARAMRGGGARPVSAAWLTALLPALAYSPLLMAENLYYPVFTFALWMILRAMIRPSPLRAAVAGAACGLAFHVKPQGLYLPAVYVGAVLADQFIEARAGGFSRAAWRSLALGVLRHAPAAAGWALALAPRLIVLARDPSIERPFALDAFLGRYGGLASGEFVVVSRGVMAKMALAYAAFAAIGVGFFPLLAPLQAFKKGAPREFRQGALLAGIALVVLATCSVWLIGGRRVHERFTVAAYPALIACFCARPEESDEAKRSFPSWLALLAAATTTYVAYRAGNIMGWFLAGDAPSGVWMLLFFHRPIVPISTWIYFAFPLIEAAAPAGYLAVKRPEAKERRGAEMAFVALFLAALCMGWQAGHVALAGRESEYARLAGREIQKHTRGREKLLILADGLDPRVVRHAAFLSPGAVVAKVPPHGAWFAYPLKLGASGEIIDPLGGESRWILASNRWRCTGPSAISTEKWALYRFGAGIFELGPSKDENAKRDR